MCVAKSTMLSQCPKLKKLVPDAPIFRMTGNKSKNAAWVGCQDLTPDNTVQQGEASLCVCDRKAKKKKIHGITPRKTML